MRLRARLIRLEKSAGEMSPALKVQMEFLDRGGRLVSAMLSDGRFVDAATASWLPKQGHLALVGVDPEVATGKKTEAEFDPAYLRESAHEDPARKTGPAARVP